MPPAFPQAVEPSGDLADPASRPAISQAPFVGGVEVESLRPKNRWLLPRIQFRFEWLLILILSAAAIILALALRNTTLVPLQTDPLRREALLATAELLETQNAALRLVAADKATQAAGLPTATSTSLPILTATPQPTPTFTATPTIALPDSSALLPISPDTVLSLAPAAALPGEFTLDAAFSPDSRLLASASASGLQIWSLPSLELVRTVESEQAIQALAFSPDSTRLVYSRSGEGNLGYLWGFDVQDGVNFTEGVLFARQLIGLAYTADGSRVVMAGLAFDQNVLLADPASGVADLIFDHPGGVRSIVTAPGSSLLASGGSDGVVRIWDASLQGAVFELPGPGPAVVSLSWSPRRDLLAGGLEDGRVLLWDARTWQQVGSLQGVAGSVAGLAFSPDGQLLAGLGSDGSLTIWAGINDAPIYRSDAPPGGRALVFSSDSFFLASAHETGLTLWAVPQPSGGE
jgi:WD40 repeat protein